MVRTRLDVLICPFDIFVEFLPKLSGDFDEFCPHISRQSGKMRPNDFRVLLVAASFEATRFGQRFVSEVLPFSFRYSVHLNQSFDDDADPESIRYPDDDGKVVRVDSEESVVELLHREGRYPEWIDVSVHAVSPSFTLLRLLCCGRFTNNRNKLLYDEGGFGPFGIKSPDLPKNWKDGSRFNLQTIQ